MESFFVRKPHIRNSVNSSIHHLNAQRIVAHTLSANYFGSSLSLSLSWFNSEIYLNQIFSIGFQIETYLDGKFTLQNINGSLANAYFNCLRFVCSLIIWFFDCGICNYFTVYPMHNIQNRKPVWHWIKSACIW